ncbi:MAG: glycosyltransferase, partial [Patescibacteria group bacterium]|nr:glycosyltransferase [Patescibacteria group bacterium]
MKILYVNFAMDFIARKKNFEIMIIKELQKLGHQITIVITDLDTSLRSNTRFSDLNQKSIEAIENPIEMEGIPVFVLHSSLPRLGMYCPNATKFARSIIKNYDLVHIANAYHHPGIVFSKIAHEYNIPYVFSAYATLQPETRSYKKRQKCLIDKLYTKKMLRHASALHSVGELETQEYIKFGADAKKIFRIDPAISLENFEIKQRTDIFNKIRLEKDDEYLLFLGRIDKRKKI